jgi:hypothetical protein
MKDGKKYENAKVLSETADSVTFDYIVVGKIHDQRTEAKSAVAQITRLRPEEMEWKELKSKLTLPMPDMTSADKYESTIQDSLRPFVTKFPGTPEAKEVEEIIKQLQEEKEKVVSGSVKMDGNWLSPELAKRDARNLEASQKLSEINALIAEGNTVEALNKWELFKASDDGYADTKQYVKAVPEIKEVISKYEKLLRQMILEQPVISRRRMDAIKGLVEPDLSRVKNAIEKELSAFKIESDEAKQLRHEWRPVYKYDLKSLEDQLKRTLEEKSLLAAINMEELQKENETISAVRHYLADKNIDKAEEALGRLSKNSKVNPNSARRVSELRSELGKMKSEASRNKAKQRIYGEVGVNTLKRAAVDSDRVAEAEAAAKEGKSSESAETEKASKLAASFGMSDTKDKSGNSTSEEKPKSKPKYANVNTAEEEGSLFQTIMLYGGLPLVLILGFFMFFKKKK